MYFSLRITPETFGCPFGLALGIVKKLLKNPKVEKDMYIVADEKTDKYGKQTHHHFHFNFIADYKKDSLTKHIVRWFQSRDYKITGNDSFALCEYNEPDDLVRWYRYCMKEKHLPQFTSLTEFSPEQISEMEICAKDERKTTIELNIKKQNQRNERKTMYEKLESHLNLNESNLKTFQSIYMSIVKYYIENNHSVNSRTIDGYTHLYMLKNQMLTIQEFYDINH